MNDVEQAKAHFFAGLDRFDAHDYAAAESEFRAALAIVPDRVSALSNLAATLVRQEKLDEGIAVARRAIALDPAAADAWMALAPALARQGQGEAALAAAERAVALLPGNEWALTTRASVLRQVKQLDRAIADYVAARRINPNKEGLLTELVGTEMAACHWTRLGADSDALLAAVRGGRAAASPFDLLSLPSTPADQLRCATAAARRDYPQKPPLWRGERYAHPRVRIAYLSGNFNRHPLAYLMTGVFERHDRQRFETVGVSWGADDGGPERKRVIAAFDRFIDVRGRGDAEIAALVREQEADIAIDLGGFTEGGRLGIFSRRPAPVHAAHLGFPGTTGAPYIDYLIADRTVIPAEAEPFYSEKVVRLPDTYYPTDDTVAIAAETPTRAEAGLPETGFVFCCFNKTAKIAPPVFSLWMDLLQAVDGSVLWLLASNPAAVGNLRREAAARGIDADRLVFAPTLPIGQHLARHRLADLFLDTLPYNAHTTATDALWAGLPVLTCPGDTFPSRVAASILHAVGLPEMITGSAGEYRGLALALAREPARLAAVKAKLAANRRTTALFDTARFTRHLEAAFLAMVDRQRRGAARASFAVPALA